MDRQQSKEETEKEKQELPLVNIELNDSLTEKEKRIGKKLIIFFSLFLFYFMCNTFNSKNSMFYKYINKLSNNHQGTLWLNLGIWIDSSKNN